MANSRPMPQACTPKDIVLKQPKQFKLVGKPIKRLDNAAKLDETAIYGIDARPEGLLYPSIALCRPGQQVQSFDGKVALAVTGARKIVVLEPYGGGIGSVRPGTGGIAVSPSMPWRAMTVDLVDVTWDEGTAAGLSSKAVIEDYQHARYPGRYNLFRNRRCRRHENRQRAISAEYTRALPGACHHGAMNCGQFKDSAATV